MILKPFFKGYNLTFLVYFEITLPFCQSLISNLSFIIIYIILYPGKLYYFIPSWPSPTHWSHLWFLFLTTHIKLIIKAPRILFSKYLCSWDTSLQPYCPHVSCGITIFHSGPLNSVSITYKGLSWRYCRLIADCDNKADTTIKWVKWILWFPSAQKLCVHYNALSVHYHYV